MNFVIELFNKMFDAYTNLRLRRQSAALSRQVDEQAGISAFHHGEKLRSHETAAWKHGWLRAANDDREICGDDSKHR